MSSLLRTIAKGLSLQAGGCEEAEAVVIHGSQTRTQAPAERQQDLAGIPTGIDCLPAPGGADLRADRKKPYTDCSSWFGKLNSLGQAHALTVPTGLPALTAVLQDRPNRPCPPTRVDGIGTSKNTTKNAKRGEIPSAAFNCHIQHHLDLPWAGWIAGGAGAVHSKADANIRKTLMATSALLPGGA